jgi:hypothetical protein
VSGAQADRELLQRLIEELRVEREPAGSAVSAYLEVLLEHLIGWLPTDWVSLPDGVTAERVGAVALAAVALLLLALVVQLLRARKAARADAGSAAPRVEAIPEKGSPAVDWRSAIEGRLAEGDVRGSLEALWRWLGDVLGAGAESESWTPRELLRHRRREDLLEHVLQLERLSYGPVPPRAAQVRALCAELQERVA